MLERTNVNFSDNIDYNEIKHLIKVNTVRDRSQAMTIPGQRREEKALQKFEDELRAELDEQHQRINLFVQSKSGEIERKLNHLYKQLLQLGQRTRTNSRQHLSLRRLERFSRIESEILKVGEEIQSLSRYTGAQRLAFYKLLKKYEKWTGSSTLAQRFKNEVLEKGTSFSRRDFVVSLSQWTDVLAAVRAPFEAGLSWRDDQSEQITDGKANNLVQHQNGDTGSIEQAAWSSTSLHTVFESGSDVDVDVALVASPKHHPSEKASYWVHPDNIVQLHVLLLRHMRIRTVKKKVKHSSKNRSQGSSPSGSVNGSGNLNVEGADVESGVIILDDLEAFARSARGTTVAALEDSSDATSEQVTGFVKYAADNDAVVVIRPSTDHTKRTRPIRRAFCKRRYLRQLFEPNDRSTLPSSHTRKAEGRVEDEGTAVDEHEAIKSWLDSHQEIQPLVHIRSKRKRFQGLGNNSSRGTWAVLDRDISLCRSSVQRLKDVEEPDLSRVDGCQMFPHSLLEVRWEGQPEPELVQALDKSHLTERVRGFSIEVHAVASLCKPQGMPVPFWIPALSRDIRKLPATLPRKRSSPTDLSPESAATLENSTCATSVADGPSSSGFLTRSSRSPNATSVPDLLETPPLKSFKKKRRKSRREHPLRKQLSTHGPYQRYWNEFDNGDEAPVPEAYTILIEPNDSLNTYPGAQTFSKLVSTISSATTSSSDKIRSWFHPKSKEPSASDSDQNYLDQRPLLHERSHPDTLISSSSSSSSSSTLNGRLHHTQYSTFPTPARPRSHSRFLSHASAFSFLASILLLSAVAILISIRHPKHHTPGTFSNDVAIVAGLSASLILSIVGVACMEIGRRKQPASYDFENDNNDNNGNNEAWKIGTVGSSVGTEWMVRTGVWLIFAILVLGDLVLGIGNLGGTGMGMGRV